ncbi:ATP-grasp domain-containing protein [Roseivivax sp. THAF30]|uniref:ATP-grasp domain-containing protein n=1 Tax=Roseivivax sp. THAF30 TaxID=2587852 RepID=UPI001267972E|nr:carbamoyl phosphate synthase-like protein [Roseivivax sp. THAF30]
MTAWGPRVLITSAGRRAGLVEAFRAAGPALGVPATIYAADMNSMLSAGCAAADYSFDVPSCTDPDYIDTLLEFCAAEDIMLLVPTIDTELAVLADASPRFAEIGCRVHVAPRALIDIARDKQRTCALLAEHGVPTPRSYTPEIARTLQDPGAWPLFAKPVAGSASRGLMKIETPRDIPARFNEPTILQEYLDGPEYTVNVFVDKYGSLRTAVPHLRLSVRAGEVEKGRTVRDPRFTQIARNLVDALPGPIGVMCYQIIDDKNSGPKVFEINARFGGGFPLADRAGATFARWLLAECLGRDSGAHDNWIDGVEMIRYDAAFFNMPQTSAACASPAK